MLIFLGMTTVSVLGTGLMCAERLTEEIVSAMKRTFLILSLDLNRPNPGLTQLALVLSMVER